jgi:pyruvate dehydrogenase E2 component (dihydrolipoamide acetyltransferase)
MATADFCMPALGADMERGTVARWRVGPGDEVHRGDVIAVIETEKSDLDVEVFQDGWIDRLLVPEGEEVEVGEPLARIRLLGAGADSASTPTIDRAAEPAEPAEPAADATPRGTAASAHAVHAAHAVHSPIVRHLAERSGVDLTHVTGTGPAGSITRADVERVASRPASGPVRRTLASPYARRLAADGAIALADITGTGANSAIVAADVHRALEDRGPSPDRVTRSPRSRHDTSDRSQSLRRSLGDLMSRSKREIPHFYASTTIDLAAATTWLQDVNAHRTVQTRMVPAALLLHAAVAGAMAEPSMNGHWIDGSFRPAAGVQLGVAVSLRGGGLVAPVIRDAHLLDRDHLMLALRDLVTRARRGSIRASEMVDPTITVTNLGDLGVDAVFGVIYPPQVAIVGFGAITDQARAVDGMLAIHPTVTATVSADHRVSDGRDAARFLSTVERTLQNPEQP